LRLRAVTGPAPGRNQQMISEERLCAGIRESTARLAGIVSGEVETRPIPTCPAWTLRQLATHVGRGQRWAAEIVARRSAEFIPFGDVPDGRLPDDPAARPDWLNYGAARLIDAVRAGGTEQVWTFTGMRPAGFWARRMAHETAVHLADAELAAGREIRIAADLAADGIDEWLWLIAEDPGDRPLPLRDEGQTLHVHATDEGLDGAGEWLVRRTAAGLAVEPGHARADVAVRGPAALLLLVLVRRLPPTEPGVQVLGDGALLGYWLDNTQF
jgi:uncharacterized protein (TIGR03083 family)